MQPFFRPNLVSLQWFKKREQESITESIKDNKEDRSGKIPESTFDSVKAAIIRGMQRLSSHPPLSYLDSLKMKGQQKKQQQQQHSKAGARQTMGESPKKNSGNETTSRGAFFKLSACWRWGT